MQAGGQIARLGVQELPGGFPGGEEGVVAIGWDLEGVDQHHPTWVLSQRPILPDDLVQAGMGNERHLPTPKVGLGGGSPEGRR